MGGKCGGKGCGWEVWWKDSGREGVYGGEGRDGGKKVEEKEYDGGKKMKEKYGRSKWVEGGGGWKNRGLRGEG